MGANPGQAARTAKERQAALRQEKLDDIEAQRLAGDLVVRRMTKAERAAWAQRRSAFKRSSTATERASRASALETRRRQADRLRD